MIDRREIISINVDDVDAVTRDTEDDAIRARLIPAALAELKKAMDEGVPVLGYLHWSPLDNFEWISGYKPKFGLASVDRATFQRTLKPSALVYCAIARRNGLEA